MDFHKSADELQTLRKKLTQAQMPCGSGPKDSVADSSEEQAERLEDQLEQLEELLCEERVLRKGNISVGKWNNERKLVEVSVAKGVHWSVFGKSIEGHVVLQPEEALYMLDHGMLELLHNELPVSVQQAYDLLLSDEFQLCHYVVYSYLRNLGFIVFRHERRKESVSKHTILNSKNAILEVEERKIGKESSEKSMEIELDLKDIKETNKDSERKAMETGYKEDVGNLIAGKLEDVCRRTIKGNVEISMDVENAEDVEGKWRKIEENVVEYEEKCKETGKEVSEGKSEEIKGSMEESQVGKIKERERKKMEDENNPVLHYWKNEDCQPLVHPSDATSLENILSKLQVIQGQTRQEVSQCSTCKFQITYDVFKPQKNFRKSDPGLPNHSICVCRFLEAPPTIGEMNFMASQSHPVPLKYAVVDGRDVSFYSVLDVQLPTYVER